MNQSIKVGEKFRIKKNVTSDHPSFAKCGCSQKYAQKQIDKKFLIKIQIPVNYKGGDYDKPNYTWFKSENGGYGFLLDEIIEPFEPRGYNHPLTKMFV